MVKVPRNYYVVKSQGYRLAHGLREDTPQECRPSKACFQFAAKGPAFPVQSASRSAPRHLHDKDEDGLEITGAT